LVLIGGFRQPDMDLLGRALKPRPDRFP